MSLSSFFSHTPADLGFQLYQDYVDCFDKHSWRQRLYGQGTFHLLVGQLPNVRTLQIRKSSNSYLDARMHVCCLSPSGTGKGMGSNFVSKMASRLGLRCEEIDKITDSGLIGTVQIDRKGNSQIEHGILHPSWGYNVVSMTEASFLIQERPPKEAQDAMLIAQKAMNPMGSADATIGKKIGFGQKIEVQPECSFLLTTYIPEALTNIVLARGFLQRMYVAVNDMTIRDREIAAQIRRERQKNPPDTNDEEKSIAERMLVVNNHYRGKKTLAFDPEAIAVFDESSQMLYRRLDGLEPFIQEKMGEFVTRYEDIQFKLALHFACLNLRDRIGYEDAHVATVQGQLLFDDLMSFLERRIVVPREYANKYAEMFNRVETTLHKLLALSEYRNSKGWVYRDHLERSIRQVHHVTELTAKTYVQTLLDNGTLVDRELRKRTVVKLKERDTQVKSSRETS